MGSFAGVHVVTPDINGDGLSDVVYSNGTWRVRLSTGAGFTQEVNTGIPAEFAVFPVIVDYESDGLDDLLLPVGDRWLVYRSDGQAYSSLRSVDSGHTESGAGPLDSPGRRSRSRRIGLVHCAHRYEEVDVRFSLGVG